MNNMKRPTDKEIKKAFEKIYTGHQNINTFIAGIDYALEYNEDDYMKVYDIGFEIDMVEIVNILENDNHLFNEYKPNCFEEINWVEDNTDELEIRLSMRYESALFDNIYIFIDDKARATISMGDTPWEGCGVEDEIEEALMSYLTKQKYK